jgi:hypothetical protein
MSGYHTTRRGVGEDYNIIQLPLGEIFHLFNQRCNTKGYPGPSYDSKYSIVQEYGRPSLSRPSQSQLPWLSSYDTEKIEKIEAESDNCENFNTQRGSECWDWETLGDSVSDDGESEEKSYYTESGEESNDEELGNSDSEESERSSCEGLEESDGEGSEESDGEGSEESDGEGSEESDGEGSEESDGEGSEESDGEGSEESDCEGLEWSD